jgi:hypothetical protein
MTKPAVKPIPDGTHSLTAHIVCANAFDAMDFYKKAFNAVEEMRMPGPDGKLTRKLGAGLDYCILSNKQGVTPIFLNAHLASHLIKRFSAIFTFIYQPVLHESIE